MKYDGFTPTQPVTIWHRLALANLEIRWNDNGDQDVILGIWPIAAEFVREQFRSAVYDLACSLRIIGEAHPRLRRICDAIAHWVGV